MEMTEGISTAPITLSGNQLLEFAQGYVKQWALMSNADRPGFLRALRYAQVDPTWSNQERAAAKWAANNIDRLSGGGNHA